VLGNAVFQPHSSSPLSTVDDDDKFSVARRECLRLTQRARVIQAAGDFDA
jgi:hypothetical protein